MKMYKPLVQGNIQLDSEKSNSVMGCCINQLTMLEALKERVLKIITASITSL